MRCPSHQKTILRQVGPGTGLGLRTHSCEECTGIWVDLAEFKNRLPKGIAVEQPRRSFRGSRPCPQCQARMDVWIADGVEVDFCECCGGAWFDKGELEKIARAQSKNHRTKKSNHAFEALDLIPDEPMIAGIKALGQSVGEALQSTPDVAESVASGVFDIVGSIFSAIDF